LQIVQTLGLKVKTRHLDSSDQWKVHCPFHIDKTPSLFISPSKFVFHCFSCQQSGSLASLYNLITGKSFYKEFNINRDEFSQFPPINSEPVDYNVLDREITISIQGIIVPYDKAIPAVGYLRKRGIPFDIAKQMDMGYLEKGFINGFSYAKRLTIPIKEQGKLISIELRDVTGKSEYKVFYPKDSTRNTLYDLDILDKHSPLYVVEGLMDLAVLRTDSFFENSTAVFGAGITPRQMFLLNQFDEVILIPDNDKAGHMTVCKLKEELTKPFKILDVPRKDVCKDVGDIPRKLHQTVEEVRHRGWGRVLRSSLSLIFY
jgi:DNA primase